MEVSRKRKAPNATPTSEDGSASKKLRLLNSSAAPGPKSDVQEVGQKIVEQLRKASDKTGRLISIDFLELPARDELPEYYQVIKLPVALDTIERMLKRNQYPTVTALESDFKRMVQNAKDFNETESEIYQDAERIRKLVFNFMKVHNPEYKNNPKYSSFPTSPSSTAVAYVQNGIHGEESEDAASEPVPVRERSKSATASKVSEQPDRKPSVAISASTGEHEADGDEDGEEGEGAIKLDFTSKTFQEAQQMMISYLLRYTDEDGLEIYSPFGNLPTRKLEDYYKVIRHPVSLKSVSKLTKGIHGRAPPTNQSDFKTWDMFEDEVSYIWRNAKDYNEDGSDMYNLANEFEEHFRTLLAEAKQKIEEPSGPRLKIAGPKPKVTLNLSQNRGSPAPGVMVDNEALARQRQLVSAGVNGQHAGHQLQRVTSAIHGTSHVPTADATRPPSSGKSGSPLGAAVKSEKASTQSPAPRTVLPAGQPLTNGMMPPPAVRRMSGSPYPPQPPLTTHHYSTPVFLPQTQLRSYPKEGALLPNVTINTHPQLKVSKSFSMSITPHATLSHQSTTTTLPSTHYFLQISPMISKQLSLSRPYKMFVTVNGTRLTQRDTQFNADSGKRTHVYEGSLAQGVNRIEVEVAATKVGDEKGLDVEKITLFANLMK